MAELSKVRPCRDSSETYVPTHHSDAGGGTRTPDTRIMIPPGFLRFTGDSANFGRQIGLFCQALCTMRTDSVRVSEH